MIAGIIFWIVLVFGIVALVKGLQQSGRVVKNTDDAPPFIIDVKPRRSCDISPLARDRQEVLEIWEKCADDPSCPPPIPPVKPTVYFGNETVAGGFDPETD
jgi:hypothetical protein